MREGRKRLPSAWHREIPHGPNRDTWRVVRQAVPEKAEKRPAPQRSPGLIPTFAPPPNPSACMPQERWALQNQECRGGENKGGIRAALAESLHPRLRSRSFPSLHASAKEPKRPTPSDGARVPKSSRAPLNGREILCRAPVSSAVLERSRHDLT